MSTRPTLNYAGVEITVTAKGEFSAEGMARHSYDTYKSICDAIDRKQKVEEKVKARKLSIAVITDDGRSAVITGIHGSNGHLLIAPNLKDGRYSTAPDLYFDTPRARECVKRYGSAKKEYEEAREALSDFRVLHDAYSAKHKSTDDVLDALEQRAKKAAEL